MGCDAWAWYAELATIATKALALVTAYDETTANQEAMNGAALQFDDLLQVGHLLAISHCCVLFTLVQYLLVPS